MPFPAKVEDSSDTGILFLGRSPPACTRMEGPGRLSAKRTNYLEIIQLCL